jgi:hypothetical protein
MAKVFAVVFGAGAAVVVLGYLVLGGLYVYNRIEAPREQPTSAQTTSASANAPTIEAVPLYDKKGSMPDVLPDAQLNCEDKNGPWLKYSGKAPVCSVEIDGKVAAVISQQEVKDNLKGWMTVASGAKSPNKDAPPPCPASDPVGLYTKSPCTPLPGR